MLEALEDRARDLGHERAVLHTSEHLTAALAFYREHGYREPNRERHVAGSFDLVHFRRSPRREPHSRIRALFDG